MVFRHTAAKDEIDKTTTSRFDSPIFVKQSYVRFTFIGANADPKSIPVRKLQETRNYLLPSKNVNNVPAYEKVLFANLYDGIDLSYYSHQQSLKYDFIVEPKAKPSLIRLNFEGSSSIEITPSGDLRLFVDGIEIIHKKPIAFQRTGTTRKEVECNYVISHNNQVSFEVGQYDSDVPLIIDPLLSYSTYLGGNAEDVILAIDSDDVGNTYVTGTTHSANFPVTSGGAIGASPSATNSQVFVAKYDANGSRIFTTYFGGTSHEVGRAIAVSTSGIFISGNTSSPDFPVTSSAFQTVFAGGPIGRNEDAFLTKLNLNGTGLIFSTFLGGNDLDIATTITLDSAGIPVVAGITQSTNYPTSPGAFQTTSAGRAGFITKLNDLGSALIFSSYLGNAYTEVGASAIGENNNVYVVGNTSDPSFPTTTGAFQTTNPGHEDGFLTKFNSNGASLI